MFKHRVKTKEFFKKNIALLLAIAMLLSSFASTGMAISSVFAASSSSTGEAAKLAEKGDNGVNFVNELLEIVTEHVPYVWGGWQRDPDGPRGVDCRGYVRVALRDTYGLDIFHTEGYLVNADGNPIDKNGNVISYANRIKIDVAAYVAEETLDDYVGHYICVEGNGIKTYYQVLCAGTVNDINNDLYQNNVLDIKTNGSTYSSLIAYACSFPGTIISHNGHYGVGIGQFNSKEELLATYPELDTYNSGANPSEGVVRWSQSSYDLGNTYSKDSLGYYFGKTVFLSACSTNSGIRADNFTTTGKTSNPGSDAELTILLCLQTVKTTDVYFNKYDATNSNQRVNGAVYGIYRDSACTKKVGEFTTSGTDSTKVTLSRGQYYVKEISAPAGYSLSTDITFVDATGSDDVTVTLKDNPVNSTVLVRKVDAHDSARVLSDATFVIQERNANGVYEDLLTLKYDLTSQGYVISGTYTNNEGTEHSDNALHYSQTNGGWFKVVERGAPKGYENSGYEKEFNVKNGALRLIGDDAVKNVAKLQLKVQKYEAGTTNPVQGAVFQFTYVDASNTTKVLTATTNASGVAVFDTVTEGAVNTGYLMELSAPEGYKIPNNYANAPGQVVALSKATRVGDVFQTTVTVNNIKEQGTEITPADSGDIVIFKFDGSDLLTAGQKGVNQAFYTIYTDSALTNVAYDKTGTVKMENLCTGMDGNGTVIAKNLEPGVYYVREVFAPYGYAVQPVTFVVHLLADGTAADGTLVANPSGINDRRQLVEINISKTDAVSGNPVADAVYALYNTTAITLELDGAEIPAYTLLGYYKTDENGNIRIIATETDAFTVGSKSFPAIQLVDDEGNSLTMFRHQSLTNGEYELIEVYAPEGYVLNSSAIVVDAEWINNSTGDDVVVGNVTVGPAGESLRVDVDIKEQRQTVEIQFNKTDAALGSYNSNLWYGLSADGYANAVSQGLVATIQGAAYQLTAASDMYDVGTGDRIPTGTVLGIYETDAYGKWKATKINVGAYDGHALPSGKYTISELNPSQGYALNETTWTIDLTWSESNSKTSVLQELNINGTESILTQNVVINKISDEGAPLGGAQFRFYRVADILSKCNITVDQLPWLTDKEQQNGYYPIDREELFALIEAHDVSPANDMSENSNIDFTTNSNGMVVTGPMLYGDYIMVEATPPTGYKPCDAMYIQLPWVLSGTADGSTESDSTMSAYIHDVTTQPTQDYIQNVVNNPETTNYKVVKIWDDNNNEFGLRPSGVSVSLYADGTKYKTIELNDGNNWSYEWTNLPKVSATGEDIVYTVQEDEVPEYYECSIVGGTITNKCTYELPTTQFTVEKQWNDKDNRDGIRPSSIQVQLYADGKACGDPVTLTAESDWKYTWTNLLQKATPTGDNIVYTVDELNTPANYDETIVGNVIINTSTYVPVVDFTVNKVWNDNNNEAGKRPSEISVQLYVNGVASGSPVILNEENAWTHTWDNLLKYDDNDKLYEYSVDEVTVPKYYTREVDGGTITNTYHEPEKVSFEVIKKWEDNNNAYQLRPGSVSVQLYADNEPYGGVVTINESMGWRFTWSDLLKYDDDDGHEIVYTVNEVITPTYYTKSVVGNVITNTCIYNPVVNIEKIDAVSKTYLPGAELAILDSNKNIVVDANGNELKWTSESTFKSIEGLPLGTYYLTEVTTPYGYQKATDVEFKVTNTVEKQTVTMEDERTYGVVELVKKDADTNNALQNVELQVLSVEKVLDPIDGTTIYEANQIVATLVTDKNGEAKMNTGVPVFTYDANGKVSPIKFKLIETKAADGAQYDTNEINIEFIFEYKDDSTPIVTRAFAVNNNKPHVTVTKTGTPETFVGKYEDRDNVTVVAVGDTIQYTIHVENTGLVSAWQIIVKDSIPENTEFVSMGNNIAGVRDVKSGTLSWTINELKAGDSIDLTFVVKVTNEDACEIVNVAQYAMPENKPDEGETFVPDETTVWSSTDCVVHQVVEFHKSSTINGGTEKTNATAVSVGDVIRYHLVFNTVDNVYNTQVIDAIPDGLTYVNNTATINGKLDTGVKYDSETNTLTFSTVDVNGENIFEFDVTVNDIPVGTETKYYENVAQVSYNSNGTNRTTLVSDVVTHKAEKNLTVTKTGTPETYVGASENATNVTVLKKEDIVEYTLTVTNNGSSVIKNIVVEDSIPEGLSYISNTTPEGVTMWNENGVLTWLIDELSAGKSIELKFKTSVTEQKTQLIINSAFYGTVSVVDNTVAPELPEDCKKTNDVVHQVIEFHKSSNVAGGTTLDDATVVAVGDTITYTLELITKHDLTNVVFKDPIPEGLSFVEGSLMFRAEGDDEWKTVEEFTQNNSTASFDTGFNVKAGKLYVRFDAVVESIPVNTEKFYVNQATVTYDRFTGDTSETPERDSLLSETVTHMTDVKVSGDKTGVIETYVGDYESRHNVTVVKDGDEITYTISVHNTGVSKINGLVIKDVVPEFTQFVKAENGGTYDKETNTVTWIVDSVESGKTATVKFIVKVNANNEAHEIRNKASYAVPADINNISDSEWLWTDEVIHQTVMVVKDASIDSGVDKSDAKHVKIGTQFTYVIKFNNTNTVYNLSIQDMIPSGLTYVNGTAKYTLSGQEQVNVEHVTVGEDNSIVFPLITEVPAGESVFVFDVVVNDVEKYDTEYFFVNKATAIVAESKDAEKGIELETNTVSHKTEKTNAIETPQLGLESTSQTVMWSLIALVSAVSAMILGIYGLGDRKKRK